MDLLDPQFALAFFGFDLEHHIGHWVRHGGPPALFGVLFACGLGLPIPEDIPLLIAGAMVATGKMHLGVAAVFAWCGIIGGDCVLYHLGKVFGLEITRVPAIGNHITRERILSLEKRFEKYGVWVVAVGRMFAIIRGAMVVCAGAIKFPFWKFIIADGLAAIVSGGLFLALGYWFGSEVDKRMGNVARAKSWVTFGLVIIVAIGVGWWWFNRRRSRRDHAKNGTAEIKLGEMTPGRPAAETSADI